MKYAIIENGKVSNIAVSNGPLSSNWIEVTGPVNIGDLYENGQFLPYNPKEDPEATELQASRVREERNRLLAASDWTQVADAPVEQLQWAIYRQSLRDITGQPGFPWDIQWPEQPE